MHKTLSLSCGLFLQVAVAAQTLTAETTVVPLDTGGEQRLILDAGKSNAGSLYLVAGSASGTAPGFQLGSLTVPLNPDLYLETFVSTAANNGIVLGGIGLLDASGRAAATFRLPKGLPASLADLQLHHAYLVVDSQQQPQAVSNAVPVLLAKTGLTVATPVAGATIGTTTARVSGVVGSAVRGAGSLRVLVNGNAANVNGDRYEIEVPLKSASNQISVLAVAGARREARTVTVTHRPLVTNNVHVAGDHAFASAGSAGVAIVQVNTRSTTVVAPPRGVDAVHELSVDGNLLFALDAATPGNLMVYSIQNPLQPKLVAGPRAVGVSPFSGVSASGGRVVVSGGTGLLNVLSYDKAGKLGNRVATIDLGIGQPDVLVAPGGAEAYVSTDFAFPVPNNQRFGITVLTLATPPTAPTVAARLGLPGARFASAGPANFQLESAVLGGLVLTAHTGGLAVIDAKKRSLSTTLNVGISGINVDALGNTAAIVGGRNLVLVDFQRPTAPVVGKPTQIPGSGNLTGVALHTNWVVMASNQGGLIVRRR